MMTTTATVLHASALLNLATMPFAVMMVVNSFGRARHEATAQLPPPPPVTRSPWRLRAMRKALTVKLFAEPAFYSLEVLVKLAHAMG